MVYKATYFEIKLFADDLYESLHHAILPVVLIFNKRSHIVSLGGLWSLIFLLLFSFRGDKCGLIFLNSGFNRAL